VKLENQWRGNYSILGQGGQGRERQSRESEIKFFAGLGSVFCPEKKLSEGGGGGGGGGAGARGGGGGGGGGANYLQEGKLPPYFPPRAYVENRRV